MTTTFRRILTAAVLAVAASSALIANSISFSTTVLSTSAPFTDTFTLDNFDTSLGSLTSVTISFAYSTTGEVDVLNSAGMATGASEAFTNATFSAPLALDGPGGLTSSGTAVAGPIAGVASPGPNSYTGLTGTGTLFITVPTADFSLFEIPPSASTDTYSVVASAGSASGTSVPGVSFGGSVSAGGTVTVTYTYTVPATTTPEPNTTALMGTALLGLALLGHRLKKRS